MVKKTYILAIACIATTYCLSSCDKVDPTGVLIGHTSVDDRVKQSYYVSKKDRSDFERESKNDDYSFLVVADSHTTTETRRLKALFEMTIKPDENNMFCAHLGDLAETQPEYYDNVKKLVDKFEAKDPNKFAFYPVVGNHDVTRNGWSLFTQIFQSSTYAVAVKRPGYIDYGEDGPLHKDDKQDLFLFFDTANGTFGKRQLEEVLPAFMAIRQYFRHCFVFTHGNFFRPRSNAYSANFPREELYFLLNEFSKNNITTVFCGHIHKPDDRVYGGVRYITLDALSERNNPSKGQILKITCKGDGTVVYDNIYVK
ncbi:MAG: metallophosphoesterase [Muribaculaceae bacterium]